MKIITPNTIRFSGILNPQDVQFYHQDGFIVIEDVFSPAEVNALREAEASPAINPPERREALKHTTLHTLEIVTQHSAFLELARDSRIISCIKPILGPDIQLQHSKLATKAVSKGVGEFAWHQDLVFYPHTNTSVLAVFVYLDDATPENGCMSMVKGSHKLGPLNHLGADGFFARACQDSSYWEDHPDRIIPITPRAGGISIHHGLTLHGSSANQSGQPRRGIVFSYRADDAQQLAEDICSDTGLVVSGSRRGIVRCESVAWPLPLKRQSTAGKNYGNAHHQTGAWAEALNTRTVCVIS